MTLSRRIALLPLMFAIVLLARLCGSAAGGSQAPVPPINTADGFALKGYDPVAYFTAGEPTPALINTHIAGWGRSTHSLPPKT